METIKRYLILTDGLLLSSVKGVAGLSYCAVTGVYYWLSEGVGYIFGTETETSDKETTDGNVSEKNSIVKEKKDVEFNFDFTCVKTIDLVRNSSGVSENNMSDVPTVEMSDEKL